MKRLECVLKNESGALVQGDSGVVCHLSFDNDAIGTHRKPGKGGLNQGQTHTPAARDGADGNQVNVATARDAESRMWIME